ncbi:MAG: hypothetical protein R3C44_18040 [Chloroflexota bacterium]
MEENDQGVKLLLEYEVLQETVQEYYQFVMGRYVPTLQTMGLQMSEAWHTAYGDAPNRLIGFVCSDWDTMQSVLESDTWLDLNTEMEKYVNDFQFKVVPYRGGFQM